MEKSILIVGAGMAGLSTGCYARMNGYNAEIFEMHKIPGGLCTAWKKKGYTFDISMHMLTGSASGPFHQMWEELGVIGHFDFFYHRQMSQIEGMGRKISFPVDRKKCEEELLEISPSDSRLIKAFTNLVFGPDLMKATSLKPAGLQTIIDKIRIIPFTLPVIRYFVKYKKMTVQHFASRFQDPFLKQAIRFFIDAPGWPMPDFPMVALTGFVKGAIVDAGVPLGGSQKVAFHMADLFTQLGGSIHYGKRVTELIMSGDRVEGVRLENGEEKRADLVVWAGDGHALHFDILQGRYLSEKIKKMYDTWQPVRPIVHVMLGVNRDMSKDPHRLIFEMEKPLTIAGEMHQWMAVINHCFDPSMAPAGKSEVEVWFDTDYDFWEKLSLNRNEYKKEKKRIADHAIRELEKRWPGFVSQVEVTDVPTPVTYHRYTGNWKGSPDGWYITPQNMGTMEPLRTVPGLGGLYMAGQWTSPFTGTVIAALSGRQIIQLLCRKDRKKFVTAKPTARLLQGDQEPKDIAVTG